MILAFDTYYYTDKAKTVCLAFENWTDAEPSQIYTDQKENIAEYEPGAFYKRELPCIISLLKKIELINIEAVIIDGFVFLDDEAKPGLGYYLYEYL
ncbi:MAG: endonuclease V, partial [Bacteroidia bacterium]|nr:endonuclease V [Bacteroidia bacterium]